MSRRLDLHALLDKYDRQKVQSTSEPTQKHSKTHHNHYVKPWNLKTQQDYYGTYNTPYKDDILFNTPADYYYPLKNKKTIVNFQMSKGECEQYLLGLREDMKQQEIRMEQNIITSITDLHQQFQRNHQILKKQLLELVSRSMDYKKREVSQMIENYKGLFAKQYESPYRKILAINKQISRLLAALNGRQFKKAIAEVVTNNFQGHVRQLREKVMVSREGHKGENFGVHLRPGKVNIIEEALQNIYQEKEQKQSINNWIPPEEIEQYKLNSRSKHRIFQQSPKLASSAQHPNKKQSTQPKRMRTTFFNFDSNN